jgi:hypothetical protein
MSSITLVDARDLERWANSRRAQEQLPGLVRRLIHATTSTAAHIGLPAGDAVQQGGYDGVVVVSETHHAVPEGMSVWELGVSANPRAKANEDYEKRKREQPVSDVGPVDPATTTFVFVTPRRWNAKGAWAEERRAEGFWRDVRVLDVDDLEGWLEQAPATHVWLSTLLGRRPVGADDLEAVWQDWSESTTPPLSPALMFAGRESSRDAISAWFTGARAEPTLGVESESPEATVALVAAAIQLLPEGERAAVLSRTVVVRDVDALLQVAAADEPIRIVTTFSPGDVVQRATRRGHRVLIPRSPGEGVTDTLEIPRLSRDGAERELKAMDLPDDRARDLAGVARRSLMALRRRLATSAAVSRPDWAAPEVGPSVLSIFFLGAVNEGVTGDAEALALLSGEGANAAFVRLTRLAAQADPPVRRVGGVWYLVSKDDAWEALSRYVTRDMLERFVTVAVGVLGSSDPSYELPPDQRWAAGLYEKTRAHSGLLVRGIADTLALLGARGGTHLVAPGVSAADYATRAVHQLFEHAGRDWQRWASLAPVFPSLMEAAPDATLSAIEAGLAGAEPSPVIGLFGHDVASLFSSSPHTNLLWALERVAWSPDYLGRAALILAELARRDPGGQLSNRPSGSLRSIFLAWMPATAAPMETRLAVIDTMREREPGSAWNLMVSILPQWHDHNMRAARPDWREWAPEIDVRVTHHMIAEHAVEIVKRLLEDAGTSGERWKTLVEALDDVPLECHEAILSRLDSLAGEPLAADSRVTIWNTLRELLSKHRSFPNADWALPAERVETIAVVFAKFEPSDPVVRDRYLFTNHATLPEGRERDYEEHHQVLAERRVDAARVWYTAIGAEALVRVSATLERADALGDALAQCGVVQSNDEPGLLRRAFEHPEFQARVFGRAYLRRRHTREGEETIPTFLRDCWADWPATVRAEALLAMSPGAEAWVEVDALGEGGRSYYWQNVPPYWVDGAGISRAIRELARHGRPHAALDLAAMHVRQAPTPAAADVASALLKAAGSAHDVTGYRSQSHDISDLLEFLEDEAEADRISLDEVAQLEFLYLVLLRHDRGPRLLHKAMGQDPSLFVDAACSAYRAEGEPEQELDDAAHGRALLAHELLSGWRTPPGLEDGVIDATRLNTWVTEARRRLAEVNRSAIGDELIGQVLSGSPPGTDGAWPAEPVRDLIEQLRSDDLDSGLRVGRFNQRGVVSRDPLSGGGLERSIKARYEADAATVAARWPRTAAFLRTLAATYQRDATREDVDAELRQDLED